MQAHSVDHSPFTRNPDVRTELLMPDHPTYDEVVEELMWRWEQGMPEAGAWNYITDRGVVEHREVTLIIDEFLRRIADRKASKSEEEDLLSPGDALQLIEAKNYSTLVAEFHKPIDKVTCEQVLEAAGKVIYDPYEREDQLVDRGEEQALDSLGKSIVDYILSYPDDRGAGELIDKCRKIFGFREVLIDRWEQLSPDDPARLRYLRYLNERDLFHETINLTSNTKTDEEFRFQTDAIDGIIKDKDLFTLAFIINTWKIIADANNHQRAVAALAEIVMTNPELITPSNCNQVVLSVVNNLHLLDSEQIGAALQISNEACVALMQHTDRFPTIDKTALFLRVTRDNDEGFYNTFKFIPSNELYSGINLTPRQILDIYQSQKENRMVLEHWEFFAPVADLETVIRNVIQNDHTSYLINFLRNNCAAIPRLSTVVYDLLQETGHAEFILVHKYFFRDCDVFAILKQAAKTGNVGLLVDNIDELTVAEQEEILSLFASSAKAFYVLENEFFKQSSTIRRNFPPERLVEIFANNGGLSTLAWVGLRLDSEGYRYLPGDMIHREISTAISSGNVGANETEFCKIDGYIRSQYSRSDLPGAFVSGYEVMGEYLSRAGYHMIEQIRAGAISEEASSLGVTEGGKAGIDQLKQKLHDVREAALQLDFSEPVLQLMIRSEVVRTMVARIFRVYQGEFHMDSEAEYHDRVEYFWEHVVLDMLQPLDKKFTPGRYDVRMIDMPAEIPRIPEDIVSKYHQTHEEVLEAVSSLRKDNAIHFLVDELKEMVNQDVEALYADINDPKTASNEKRLYNLRLRQAMLDELHESANRGDISGENFVLRKPEGLPLVIKNLSKFEKLAPKLRTILFAWELRNDPARQQRLENLASDPEISDVAELEALLSDIATKPEYGEHLTKKQAAQFRSLVDAKPFRTAIERHYALADRAGTQPLHILPTRGFAMEMSGDVSDTCWSNKYASISDEFPNFTSLIFRRGKRGASNERLVGGAFLIDTHDDQGNPVLLLRGLNPIENYINKVDAEDFYLKIIDYVKSVAAKTGAIPAIVIDNHQGGSGTNREALHVLLDKLASQYTKLRVQTTDTSFNNYDDMDEKSYRIS